MEMIADTGQMCSLDVMELNPALDVRNQTAKTAVELIESLFGKSTLMRKPIPAASDRAHAVQWSGPAESSRMRESLRLVSTHDL